MSHCRWTWGLVPPARCLWQSSELAPALPHGAWPAPGQSGQHGGPGDRRPLYLQNKHCLLEAGIQLHQRPDQGRIYPIVLFVRVSEKNIKFR